VLRRRGRERLIHRLLLAADLVGLALAFFTSQLLFEPSTNMSDRVSPGWEALVFFLVLPLWVVTAYGSGLYSRDGRRPDHSTVDDFVGVFAVVTIGTWLFWALASSTHALSSNPPRMVAFWAMAIAFVATGRVAARSLARRGSLFVQNALIVGTGEVGQLIARKLLRHPEYKVRLMGFVDDRPRMRMRDVGQYRVLGRPDRLPEIVEAFQIDRVIIASSSDPNEQLLRIIHRLRASSVQIDLVPHLFEAVDPRVDLHTIEALPLVGLAPVRLSPLGRVAKRTIDLLIAGAVLVAAAPLFAYIAWRIKRDSPGPAFFRQTRLGLNMKAFTALKFRTMWTDIDDSCHRDYIRSSMTWRDTPTTQNGLYKLDRPGDVTPFGRYLRKTSLDELPQLINVLKGDMSLVGPRPCISYETENFAPHHFERFLVPPGITGLWQVTARAHASFGEALDMDVAYARGWSLGLDLRLICRTPLAVLRQAATA
jgi:exopolysaccharide biosynthesis polyprenyl glycosylphosphotransferase